MSSEQTHIPFSAMLIKQGVQLRRVATTTLQVNVGLICNQACKHCHLDAGPGRREAMDNTTMAAVAAYAERSGFKAIDITGGAPELVPGIKDFVQRLAGLTPRLIFRSNLSALHDRDNPSLLKTLVANKIVIIASFPSINASQTDNQRGRGIFEKSVATLQKLNASGYGKADTGLELNLVSNPSGAFLPQGQEHAQKRFRKVLDEKWGIVFNSLFSFANVPLGRFRDWLERTGNLERYVEKLADSFNPCAVEGLMCRSQVSVSWDGYLYDCDFNLAADLPLSGKKIHVSELQGPPAEKSAISVADYCYTCTAGTGFT
ncbi:MAG: radical SAM/Cys-rich domain protein [Desulfobacterales bacterium]|nr:radical SAM/Cys-rich domain protein [Desulfobacterales bacterium]